MRKGLMIVLTAVLLSGCSSAFWSAMGDGLKGASAARARSAASTPAPKQQEPDVVVCRRNGNTAICY